MKRFSFVYIKSCMMKRSYMTSFIKHWAKTVLELFQAEHWPVNIRVLKALVFIKKANLKAYFANFGKLQIFRNLERQKNIDHPFRL